MKILIQWLQFNLICGVGLVVLIATGKVVRIEEAFPSMIMFSLLSLAAISLQHFLRKGSYEEKP